TTINLLLLEWIPFLAVNTPFKLKTWKQAKFCLQKLKKQLEAVLGQPIINRCSILEKTNKRCVPTVFLNILYETTLRKTNIFSQKKTKRSIHISIVQNRRNI